MKVNYSFSIKVSSTLPFNDTGSEILNEECTISDGSFYRIKNNKLEKTNIKSPPNLSSKHLYLVRASGIGNFSIVFDYLSNMSFYNPIPHSIKSRRLDSNTYKVSKDADNLFNTMFNSRFQKSTGSRKISDYLTKIIQNYTGIAFTHTDLPDVGISQGLGDETFWSQNLSDGTLRAIAILFILFQSSFTKELKFLIIGIEEPELALHPAATSVLLDAMREASQNTQILVTTHSPDLLDNVDLENGDELVLAVDARDGETIIAPIDSASREIVKENLFSLGDLLRMRQLEPEITQPKEQV